jgi:hypothetical protein
MPDNETTEIWMARSAHLAYEGVTLPSGVLAPIFFTNAFTSAPHNAGEMAKVAELVSMYVRNTFLDETMLAHTARTQGGEHDRLHLQACQIA